MSVEPGQTLLHYRIVEKIGEGGMGVVWKALDTALDREVAIKILPEALALDQERLARFEREAKLLASLDHPNIATVHGLLSDGKIRFLNINEYIRVKDLTQDPKVKILTDPEVVVVTVIPPVKEEEVVVEEPEEGAEPELIKRGKAEEEEAEKKPEEKTEST